jgi:hypothetical protein
MEYGTDGVKAPTVDRGADDGVRPYTVQIVSGSGQLNPLPNIHGSRRIIF